MGNTEFGLWGPSRRFHTTICQCDPAQCELTSLCAGAAIYANLHHSHNTDVVKTTWWLWSDSNKRCKCIRNDNVTSVCYDQMLTATITSTMRKKRTSHQDKSCFCRKYRTFSHDFITWKLIQLTNEINLRRNKISRYSICISWFSLPLIPQIKYINKKSKLQLISRIIWFILNMLSATLSPSLWRSQRNCKVIEPTAVSSAVTPRNPMIG